MSVILELVNVPSSFSVSRVKSMVEFLTGIRPFEVAPYVDDANMLQEGAFIVSFVSPLSADELAERLISAVDTLDRIQARKFEAKSDHGLTASERASGSLRKRWPV